MSVGYPTRGLHGRVVHDVGIRIVSGEIPPGESLPTEDDLSRELGVSRTVIREAIKVLVAKGLVEVRPRTGTRTRPRRFWSLLDPDVLLWQFEQMERLEDVEELTEVRSTVASAAARLAAERRTDDELATIEAHLRRMEDSLDEFDAFFTADLDFQSAVFEASHNNLLLHINAMVRVALEAGAAIFDNEKREMSTVALRQAVVEAIRDGNPADAEKAMRAVANGPILGRPQDDTGSE